MQLHGLAERTQESYLRSIRKFAQRLDQVPDTAGEDDLRRYLLHLKNDQHWQGDSLKVAFAGLKFYFTRTCPRDPCNATHQLTADFNYSSDCLPSPTVLRGRGAGVRGREPGRPPAFVRDAPDRNQVAERSRVQSVGPPPSPREPSKSSEAVGDARQALRYLTPYVFRVALSPRRIVGCEPGPDGRGRVTITYRRSGQSRYRPMTVTADEFLRQYLQHVLPRGFQKVRHYGFAHP